LAVAAGTVEPTDKTSEQTGVPVLRTQKADLKSGGHITLELTEDESRAVRHLLNKQSLT